MDKNTRIGLLLILLILGVYFYFENKNFEKVNEERKKIESQQAKAIQPELSQADSVKELKDSLVLAEKRASAEAGMGVTLASNLEGKEEFFTYENEKLIFTFTNKGARIYSVEFKEYKNYSDYKKGDDKPLKFFTGENNDFALSFFSKSQNITTSSFYFQPQTLKDAIVSEDSLNIPFRLYADSASYIEFVYTLYKNDYKVGFRSNFVNMKGYINEQTSSLDLLWKMTVFNQEKSFSGENNYTTIAYKFPGETSIEELSTGKDKLAEEVVQRTEWINFKQHFFSAILVAKESTNNDLSYVSYAEGNPENFLKTFSAKIQLPYNIQEQSVNMDLYFVPNHFRTLKAYKMSFEKIITLGGWVIGIINRAVVIPVFNFLRDYVSSFGLIILVLTLIIKLILTPLTWKSYMSTAKMKVLKPEIDKINARYPDKKDAMKKQQETMALYSRTGVSIMGGCLPMLLQLPIFYALFRFFPSSIELRQEGFLWADDLSAYDSILNLPFSIPLYGAHVSLFTILMAASMFISTKINMSQQTAANDQMKQMNAMMLYIMPLMMLFFLNNFSSALTYYYFLSNIITIGQNYVIKKFFVNEEELLRKMNERAKKPVKKSKFQERLDKMMKEQQAQQTTRNKQNKR